MSPRCTFRTQLHSLRMSALLRPRALHAWHPQVSLDPVNPQICPYPPPFNRQLEEAFQASVGVGAPSLQCALGPDFFNSTIHFQTEGEKQGAHFQTTPSVNYGPRGGTKPAGWVGADGLPAGFAAPVLVLC